MLRIPLGLGPLARGFARAVAVASPDPDPEDEAAARGKDGVFATALPARAIRGAPGIGLSAGLDFSAAVRSMGTFAFFVVAVAFALAPFPACVLTSAAGATAG